MATQKRRGGIVDTITHRVTERVGHVRLDKASMEFFAEVEQKDGRVVSHASRDGSEVKRWLETQLAKADKVQLLKWLPVVAVRVTKGAESYGESAELDAGIGLRAERFWLALTDDEKEWRRLEWSQCVDGSKGAVPEALRYSQSKRWAKGPGEKDYTRDERGNTEQVFLLPSVSTERSYGVKGGTYFVPYTADLWRGLQRISQTIKAAHETVTELVGTEEGMATLAEVGAGKAVLQLGPGS